MTTARTRIYTVNVHRMGGFIETHTVTATNQADAKAQVAARYTNPLTVHHLVAWATR